MRKILNLKNKKYSKVSHFFQYVPNNHFKNRYILPEKLFEYLTAHYSSNIQQIGTSVLGNPIYLFSKGEGNVKILAWSQMHGNESTGTLAMLDLLYSLEKREGQMNRLFKGISLDFVFMLNPDGAKTWKRRNAVDIDLNRDYLKESSPEIKILKELIKKKKYDYALNLHDQRTVFTTDGENPATLSFLAPSFNEERDLNEVRKKSMAIISHIYFSLKREIPKNMGRYTDKFYPHSTGDNFMLAGIPTVLFEGGHFPDDYLRQHTRKYYTYALYYALAAMAMLHGDTFNYESYFEIPENRESHVDIIYRNLKLNTKVECIVDVAVKFEEQIEEGAEEIFLVPVVCEIGDLKNKKAWKEIDATGKKMVSEAKYPKLNKKVNFTLE